MISNFFSLTYCKFKQHISTILSENTACDKGLVYCRCGLVAIEQPQTSDYQMSVDIYKCRGVSYFKCQGCVSATINQPQTSNYQDYQMSVDIYKYRRVSYVVVHYKHYKFPEQKKTLVHC